MMDPQLGRWLMDDPEGFGAGDMNLYRYVGNNPTNVVDPSGLWKWELGPKGEVFAISEKDDKLNDLLQQGYNEKLIAAAAEKYKVKSDAKLPEGMKIDVTTALPEAVRTVISRQQQLEVTGTFRKDLERNGAKGMPEKCTLGTSGVDLMQNASDDKENDTPKILALSSQSFGWSNCYGFVALWLGAELPNGVMAQNFVASAIKGEKVAGSKDAPEKGGLRFEDRLKDRVGRAAIYAPDGGLLPFLTKNRKATDKPNFGAVALYESESHGGVIHTAIVLGRSQNGDLYVIQKNNTFQPYAVSTLRRYYSNPDFYKISFYQ